MFHPIGRDVPSGAPAIHNRCNRNFADASVESPFLEIAALEKRVTSCTGPFGEIMMLRITLLSLLSIGTATTLEQPDPDPYGKNGPCAYLFKIPGGECMHGEFELEIQIDSDRQVTSSRVISVSTESDSSGPIDQVAECQSNHMTYYAKWNVNADDKPGLVRRTIHVVNFSCRDRYLRDSSRSSEP
jgi:hypothetical protein